MLAVCACVSVCLCMYVTVATTAVLFIMSGRPAPLPNLPCITHCTNNYDIRITLCHVAMSSEYMTVCKQPVTVEPRLRTLRIKNVIHLASLYN